MIAPASVLSGRGVLVTRPARQAESLSRLIVARGARVLRFPTIEIVALEEPALLPGMNETLAVADLLIFISANAVQYGWPLVMRSGGLRSGVQCAAIGNATARALRERGVTHVIHPTTVADSEALLQLEPMQSVSGKRIVIVSGVGGRGLLRDVLARRGAIVDVVECYRRQRPQADASQVERAIRERRIDAIAVSSAEGLANLYAMLSAECGAAAKQVPHFVPHARIAESALSLGVTRAIVTEPGDEALIAAIELTLDENQDSDAKGAMP